MHNPVPLEYTMFRTRHAVLLWLAAAAFGPSAAAAVVSYGFTVGATSGPLALQSFSGSFAFDDAVPPTMGAGGEDLYALTSFSFVFDGISFGLADLDYGDAAFVGGTFTGLDAGSATFTFLPAIGSLPPAFLYDLGIAGSGEGNVTFIPEPAAGLLAATAFGALLAGRRRQPNAR
jgi:hypothetical protein